LGSSKASKRNSALARLARKAPKMTIDQGLADRRDEAVGAERHRVELVRAHDAGDEPSRGDHQADDDAADQVLTTLPEGAVLEAIDEQPGNHERDDDAPEHFALGGEQPGERVY
jgi:hypothetical protein